MALERMEEDEGMMSRLMMMDVTPEEGDESRRRVAAGTATYHTSCSRTSLRCSFDDSCSAYSSSTEDEQDDHGGVEEEVANENTLRPSSLLETTSPPKPPSRSTQTTTTTIPSITRAGRRRSTGGVSTRNLVVSSSLLAVFLLVFSQNAQECASEVVRLRHPDHLYYGDRGGGGGEPPIQILHRHSKKLEKEERQDYFATRHGMEDIDAEGVVVSEQGNAGMMNILDEDVDDSEVESLLGHTYSSSGHTHSGAFSANLLQQQQHKRKSHVDSNNNNNNNYNSNNNNDSNNRNISGSDDNSNSRNNNVNGFISSSGYTSNSYKNNNKIFNKAQQEQLQHKSSDEHHHSEPAALEDVELPVYFARQGNDDPLEIDQPLVDVSGTSPRGPSTLSGGGITSGSDSPTNSALGSETTPTGTGTEPPVEADGKLFPPDLFTLEQRRNGAVVFYIMGVMYMFVALAIVCDEFFVPSLDCIIEFLGIADDVAGATFMAAGGSAPELFTSVIGVFISKDDVGIGTIVGSAVFNILFVIGMCALFSKTVLRLTWWPLFRDCTFYSVALITLIFFFRDSYIYWWEALILFSIYICYVTFMKFNQTFERAVKKLLFKNRVTRVSSTDQLVNNKSVNNGASSSQTSVQTVSGNQSSRGSATLKPPLSASGRRNSMPMLHSGSKFRHGLLQLMIQSIDPLHDGRVDEKATQLHAIASLKALLDAAKTEADSTVTNNSRSKPVVPPQNPASVQPGDAPLTTVDIEDQQANGDAPTAQELAALAEAQDEGHEPLDISWPSGSCKKQISYIILFPIMICLFLTLPDTRTPRGKKFFYWGFLGSILWIAVFSYFMVWWADRTGETFGIAPEIMGLTFLAAGTSIPDLITSVIVARKGLGDMAVSSSVGSNIFDVCVGLPVPWLLYGLAKGEPVEVSAKGMLCSISILFGMLCFVVISIMVYRWQMSKGLGMVMFVLYFIFLGVSLLFEYGVITCPKFLEA